MKSYAHIYQTVCKIVLYKRVAILIVLHFENTKKKQLSQFCSAVSYWPVSGYLWSVNGASLLQSGRFDRLPCVIITEVTECILLTSSIYKTHRSFSPVVVALMHIMTVAHYTCSPCIHLSLPERDCNQLAIDQVINLTAATRHAARYCNAKKPNLFFSRPTHLPLSTERCGGNVQARSKARKQNYTRPPSWILSKVVFRAKRLYLDSAQLNPAQLISAQLITAGVKRFKF